jgi:hypothetical protein
MEFHSEKDVQIMDILRYKGKWYKVEAKAYEPESQTYQIAWAQILNPSLSPEDAYRQYFENQRSEAKVLYPSFRKDVE